MVSFTTLSRCVSIILVVSSSFMGTSAAPVSPGDVATSYNLPPLIQDRIQPVKNPKWTFDPDMEKKIARKNRDWYAKHNGQTPVKRQGEVIDGNYMDLPPNAPPLVSPSGEGVVTATAAQVAAMKKYIQMSATAYCRSVVPLEIWRCDECENAAPDGELIDSFSSLIADTNGFVLRSDSQKTIYLVFRGTSSIRSAIVDMVFTLADYSPVRGARVHAGFLASYRAVVNSYFSLIQTQLTRYPTYKVIVTGHSLGGAQAVLAGLDLYQRLPQLNPSNLEIITVGAPRVGNSDFAYYTASTNIPVTRIVNQRDIVPHVPPTSWFYLHSGVEAWIVDSRNTVQICQSQIETEHCANSIAPFTSFTDHLNYLDVSTGVCL